jgi:hypothetical protein
MRSHNPSRPRGLAAPPSGRQAAPSCRMLAAGRVELQRRTWLGKVARFAHSTVGSASALREFLEAESAAIRRPGKLCEARYGRKKPGDPGLPTAGAVLRKLGPASSKRGSLTTVRRTGATHACAAQPQITGRDSALARSSPTPPSPCGRESEGRVQESGPDSSEQR